MSQLIEDSDVKMNSAPHDLARNHGDSTQYLPKPLLVEDAAQDDEESDEFEPVVRNRFDLLLGSGDEDDEKEDEDEDENDDAAEVKEPKQPAKVQVASHKKKYKKKKRKKKAKNENAHDEDWEALADLDNLDPGATKAKETESEQQEEFVPLPDSVFVDGDDDALREMANEIYAAVWEIYLERKTQEEKETSLYLSKLHPSLKEISVDSRLLSADAELKKLFGARVVEAERRNEEQELAAMHGGHGGRRRRGGGGRGRGMKPMRNNSKFSLINPREGWFSNATGLSMVPEDKESNLKGIRYFKYVHDGTYLKLQADYNMAVQTMNPNNIQAIVSRYPFHIDSLLQFSEVYRSMGELDRAAEYVERAIYILEGTWNLAFKPFNGEGRIRFEVQENKAIFVALARYVLLLSRRGLYRTALEISKLILNFDPDSDPMGILLLIDSFALLSHQYTWVCEMRENFKLIPLKYFPNFALSTALALNAIKDGDGKRLGGASSSNSKPSKKQSKKKSQQVDSSKYDHLSVHDHLTQTLLTFPMVLRPLLAATKDSGGSWSSHWLYSSSNNQGVDGVFYRIAKIYATRSNLLWTAPKAKALLFRAAEAATIIADKREEDVRNAQARKDRKEASEWFTQCGMYRTLQVADFADSGAPEITQDLLDNDDTAPIGPAAPPEVRNVGLGESMREFLHSLLPWRDAESAVQEAEEAVRNSPVDPMNAIRELLNNRGWLNRGNGAEAEGGNDDETARDD